MINSVEVFYIDSIPILYEDKGQQINVYIKDCIAAAIQEGYKEGKVYGNRKKTTGRWEIVTRITSNVIDNGTE